MKRDNAADAARIINLSLRATKSQTISAIYKRIRPGRDGRIRTVMSPVGTETGRFSHGDTFLEESTNLGNMPKKAAALDPLYEVRNVMIARPGHVFVEADLNQAELFTTAAYAGDTAKIDRLYHGDEHRLLASVVFGVRPEDVDKKTQRPIGKAGNHKLNYGAGVAKFVEGVNKDADITGIAITYATGQRVIDAWRALNPLTVAWWTSTWDKVQRDGHLITQPFGRRRDFLSPFARMNDAVAYLPQSTIADLLNWRMTEAFEHDDLIRETLLLQIHDALLCEPREEDAEECAARLKRWLEYPITINGITITVPVDISIGRSWGDMH